MSLVQTLIHLGYGISDGTVLNRDAGPPSANQGPDPDHLGDLLLGLKTQTSSTRARDLEYGFVTNSEAYSAYRRYLAELRSFDPKLLGRRERQLAFWVNLYNGLMLDAVVQWRVTRSVQEVPGFFWRAAYNIGGLRYSANDIENGILRGNASHPVVPGAPFAGPDPRRAFSLPRVDPRVHFALVCASRSCPPIAVYDADRIDAQLDEATRSFVRGGGVEMDATRGRIRLSRLFQWYAVDFGGPWLAIGDRRPLLRFIAAYLDPTDAKLVLARRSWTVAFMTYDWSLNGRWATEDAYAASKG